MIPPNSLHRDVELGENDLLPAEGQWNVFYLLPLQMILLSASDRRCFFYVFKVPKGGAGVFACVDGLSGVTSAWSATA